MDKELDLAVTCYGKVKPLKYDLVLLPWGATEPHNLHLPYLTDCILSHDIALDAAFASQMLNEKVAWIPRNWQKVSQDTGIGNPKKASAEKGKKYAEAVVAKYALLFEELVHKELY